MRSSFLCTVFCSLSVCSSNAAVWRCVGPRENSRRKRCFAMDNTEILELDRVGMETIRVR